MAASGANPDVTRLAPKRHRAGAARQDTPSSSIDPETVTHVVHEVRNHFHRLYHWVEVLEAEPLRTEGRDALDAVTATLHALDHFVIGAFEVFKPIVLTPIRMSGREIIDNMAVVIRGHAGGVPVDVEAPDGLEDVYLAIDGGHISAAIEVLVRRLVGEGGGSGRLTLSATVGAREDSAILTIQLHLQVVRAVPTARLPLVAEIEWAAVERVMAQHGGTILLEEGAGGDERVTLALPLEQ